MKMLKVVFTALLLLSLSCEVLAQGVTLPATLRITLDNGTVLILNEKHDVPLIGVQAVLKGGAVTDPDGKNGIAELFAAVIQKGAGNRDSAEFAEAIDAVGGSLSASAGLEGISISGSFLARDADLMIELLADMLTRPTLSVEEMDKLRDRSINFIRSAKDTSLGALMPIYGSAFLFGEHPYGNPLSGSESTLANITHDDLLTYFEDEIGSDRLVVSVSGDFETSEMKAKLTDALGDWRPAQSDLPIINEASPVTGRRVLLIDKPGATQTYFWIGNTGVAVDYENRAELNLANTVFGGRFTSMLNTELRVKTGLTYGARSVLSRPSQPGSVAISSYTRTDATIEAIDMALGVLGQLRDTGIDDEMIQSSKNYVLGQFPTQLETASQLAAQFSQLEAYGLDAAYVNDYGSNIADATRESITAVIDAVYPSSENLVFVLLGDASLIREEIAKYGSVTEVSITDPRFRH